MPFVRSVAAAGGGIELDIWVVPRASRPGLGPVEAGRDRLRAAVSAPPVDGAANEAVRELVAEALHVPRGQVSIVRGATGRQKTLRVVGDSRLLLERVEALAVAREKR